MPRPKKAVVKVVKKAAKKEVIKKPIPVKPTPVKTVEVVVPLVEITMVDGVKFSAKIRENGLADIGIGLAFQRDDGVWMYQE